MNGNYMGTPHTNNNYPQNPSNNARQGSGAQKNTQGEQISFTYKAGETGRAGETGPAKGGMPQKQAMPGGMTKQQAMPMLNLANGLGLGNFINPRYGRYA